MGQNDSAKPCSAQKSPFALNTGINAGLHRVQTDSSTPCSAQSASAAGAGVFSAALVRGVAESCAQPPSKATAHRTDAGRPFIVGSRLGRANDLQVRIAELALRLGDPVFWAPVA